LRTNANFSANVALYARRGFEKFLREPLPATGEVVHMRKSIKPYS